ncbi:MAG: DUF2141 domain-containing protein [Sphingorhabdus sp.]|uniref:DUF2141 domain-containing protein n=1 Tax=Sphingorhabdus sp. TaxID=1902408 RepID=UPI0038FCC7AE
MMKFVMICAFSVLALGAGTAVAGQEVGNDMSRCAADKGPSVLVVVRGVKESAGKIRVQSYPATGNAWLAKGRWLHRIESRANSGNMNFCVPVPSEGRYGIAVRHDRNGNGKTDISQDGGGFSNNPSISILNLGKPSVSKVAFQAGPGVTKITINLKYL